MALRKIEIPKTEFTFSDGQTVELKAPTLDILQNAQKKAKDEIEQVKLMLIEMSDGEMDKEFLGSLPMSEWSELSKAVSAFMGIDVKN
nr:MAG TPA: tail assembly chaperone protein [Caudoviricetes sp.]